MFMKLSHSLFFTLLIIGTLIAISSNSWFTAWLGLEINLMSMIPLILISLNKDYTEAAIKYFLTQAMASIILIFSISVSLSLFEVLNTEVLEIFISLALVMKMGMAPLHFWFPQVSNNLNWIQCMILFTWQKIAPLILIISMSVKIIFLATIMSAVIGAAGGFNQMIFKLLLTYSSISHGSWMMISCLMNFKVWLVYFLIYSILSFSIILFLMDNKTKKINQMFFSKEFLTMKMIFILNMLSLGGLPPLLGFSAKLMIILLSMKFNLVLIFIPLILSSLISLFFYSRMIYSNLMNMNKTLSTNLIKSKKVLSVFFYLSLMLNLASPMFFIF